MAEKYVCNLLKSLRKDAGLTQKELEIGRAHV